MKDFIVETQYGKVQGILGWDPRIIDFKGIPFAAPPVGELRWKAPQPHDKWEGIYKADHYGPMALQVHPGSVEEFWKDEIHPTGLDFKQSEDCLYLNVFTPARRGDENLPVLVYIHGGGFAGGYPYEVEFDWEHMARKGMVVVAITYRLGVMGYFACPELSAEAPDAPKGNFGVQDQIFALKWVRDNIRGFGGNPDCVTIAGQSAGAMSVQCMMIAEEAKGLFHRAIIESTVDGGQGGPKYPIALDKTEEVGQKVLDGLHMNLAEARQIPADQIIGLVNGVLGRGIHFQPTMDNILFTETPFQAFKSGRHADVPVIAGYNRGEVTRRKRDGSGFNMADYEEIAASYGQYEEEFRKLCPVTTDEEADKVLRQDDFIASIISNRQFGQIQNSLGRKGFIYEFNAPIPGDDAPGAYHGSEMWFAYDGIARCWRPFEGYHYDLARQVSSYWTNFIKNGDPNGKDTIGRDLPVWEAYTPENEFVLEFTKAPAKSAGKTTELMKLKIRKTLEG